MAEHQPTAETRAQVKAMAHFGIKHADIASYAGITDKTLRKHYSEELKAGKTEATMQVSRALYEMATNGDTAAAIFWMKSQAGWSDKGNFDYAYDAEEEAANANSGPASIALIGVEPDRPDSDNLGSRTIDAEPEANPAEEGDER